MKLQPAYLQMSIQIEGRSSDLPQAAAELKKRIKRALEHLQTLDAIETSVSVSKPVLQGTSSSSQAKRMQQMMQQYGGGSRGREMLEKTKSVSILQTVTARWPLQGDDDLDRLVSTHKLTQEIEAADLASSTAEQPVSPAQEELAEEMTAMMAEYNNYGEEKPKAGKPSFTFVAIIPADDHAKAIRDAFDNAKQQIELLAESTDSKIQSPEPMTSTLSISGAAEYANYGRSSAPVPKRNDAGDYELVASDPNEAICKVSVTAIGKHRPE